MTGGLSGAINAGVNGQNILSGALMGAAVGAATSAAINVLSTPPPVPVAQTPETQPSNDITDPPPNRALASLNPDGKTIATIGSQGTTFNYTVSANSGASASLNWSQNMQDTLGYGTGGLTPSYPGTLSPGAVQVITGTITLATSIPTAIFGAALSETGIGAIAGVPMMIAGGTSFGLGLTSIGNGLFGGGLVNTPSGTIPQGMFGLGGAMTGNSNLQTFGDMGDSVLPLPTDWTAIGTGASILLNPPTFNPNAWPFAYPNNNSSGGQ